MNTLKRDRITSGLTLREYCRRNGLDPVAYSRLERGVQGPLTDEQVLSKLPAIVPPGCDVERLVEAVRNA